MPNFKKNVILDLMPYVLTKAMFTYRVKYLYTFVRLSAVSEQSP